MAREDAYAWTYIVTNKPHGVRIRAWQATSSGGSTNTVAAKDRHFAADTI